MPHNLYLHSGVVQTRKFGDSVPERREAINLATVDSTIALMFALLINASILILAAATFNKAGKTDIAELEQVHSFLILSQVILSLQLPFAIVPLVMFTADRRKMGELIAPRWVTALAALTAAVIISLNVKLLYDFATG
jgi:Mn2+/Fe2+ NRAMP family transporter